MTPLECPRCGSTGVFAVDTTITVHLTVDQEIDTSDVDLDRDISIGDDDNVFCPRCGFEYPFRELRGESST